MKQITILQTNKLVHHPKNPRASYDDIDTLIESMKQNGFMENFPLTVVDCENGFYNVVAGNRRLEAARAAGFLTCPCIVSDMSEQDQAALMLTENMQRKSLTPVEECRGVQMCLDLGIDEADIAKKTGLSRETIRHRRKMAELDQEKLEEVCQDRQISIQELISLEKIKDIETRNDVLETAGTKDFTWSLNNAIASEKREEDRRAAYRILITFAEEMPEGWNDNSYRQAAYNLSGEIEIPEDAHEAQYVFKPSWKGSSTYSLYKLREDVDEDDEDPEEAPYEIHRRKMDECKAKLNELGETFFNMRKEFMQNRTYQFDGNIIAWLVYLFIQDELPEEGTKDFPWVDYLGCMHLELFKEINLEEEEVENDAAYILDSVSKEAGKRYSTPDTAVTFVYTILETKRISCARWQGDFDEDDTSYKRLYEFIKLCGYKISSEEQKILDGTHEYYYREDYDV